MRALGTHIYRFEHINKSHSKYICTYLWMLIASQMPAYRQIIPYSKNKQAFFTFFLLQNWFHIEISSIRESEPIWAAVHHGLLFNSNRIVLWVQSLTKHYQKYIYGESDEHLHIFASTRSFFGGISPRDAQIAYKWLIWFDVNANRLDKIANLLFRNIYEIAINEHLAVHHRV